MGNYNNLTEEEALIEFNKVLNQSNAFTAAQVLAEIKKIPDQTKDFLSQIRNNKISHQDIVKSAQADPMKVSVAIASMIDAKKSNDDIEKKAIVAALIGGGIMASIASVAVITICAVAVMISPLVIPLSIALIILGILILILGVGLEIAAAIINLLA